MKLIFIRHGEPDYHIDGLTNNGWAEVKALAERTKNWKVTQFYVSPQGRANDTAKYTLEAHNAEAITLDYMREFSYMIDDPVTKRKGVPWDFVPSNWTADDCMFNQGDSFTSFDTIKSNPKIAEQYPIVINSFDELLKEYGYIRTGRYYRNINSKKRYITSTVDENDNIRNNGPYAESGEDEPTLVFFCHLGITCLILSHLLNIPFECMTHGFFMPTSSVTIVSSEERWADEAYFRVQCLGDVTHLKDANIPISPAGSFTDIFQQ